MEQTKEIVITQQIQQEFAVVDSIITAHTNTAIAKVNAESLQTRWEVGAYVSARLKSSAWGDHVVSELADYLVRVNPKRRGYSKRNLYNMVRLYETYSSQEYLQLVEQLQLSEFVQSQTAQIQAEKIVQTLPTQTSGQEIVQLPTAQFIPTPIPPLLCLTTFTNHNEILNRYNNYEEYIFYILYSADQHLKVEELRHCIVNQTFSNIMSQGKMMTDVLKNEYPGAEYMLKDKVLLDFLGLKEKHTEPQMHASILEHMKQFILELGKDFIFMGDEYTVTIGNKEKRIDLLFFHRALQCLVAVELKAVDFEPEFVSKDGPVPRSPRPRLQTPKRKPIGWHHPVSVSRQG